MKLILALALTLAASPVFADMCPPAPSQEPRKSELMAQIRAAPDEAAAKALTNTLWGLWATAPDAWAQELLDEGMQRRAAYDFAGAIKAFDALIAYCPAYAEGYNQRGFVRFIQRDYAPAMDDLELALERAPDHFAALTGLAMTQMSLGQVAAGNDSLRAALEMNPWLPERHMILPEPGDDI